jgi:hypothetical protein
MNLNQKRLSLILCILVAVCSVNIYATVNSEKKAFTIDDYARWQSIVSTAISHDGNWMTFGYRKVKADDTLYVKSLTSDKEYEIPRGSRPKFSDDSKWIAALSARNGKKPRSCAKTKSPSRIRRN